MGHQKFRQKNGKQQSFMDVHWQHRFSHGGLLRNKRKGRGQRPLSSKDPLHLVLKVNSQRLRHRSLRSTVGFPLVLEVVKKYSQKFAVKVEQLSVQNDHIHLLIRFSRRQQCHYFFRVLAGQIAQRLEGAGLFVPSPGRVTDTHADNRVPQSIGQRIGKRIRLSASLKHERVLNLWKHRPFSRVIKGWKAYQVVRNYIQLNEKEVRSEIRYQKQRLRGLSSSEWELLWR